MTVLVAAASKHGATAQIAARIGADLAEHGVAVEVKDLGHVRDPGKYDAFVIGSGVYLGQWLKPARTFVDAHAHELAQRPTWLFASGSIVGDPPVGDDPNAVRASHVAKREPKHASTSCSPGSSTRANSASWRKPPSAAHTQPRATIATGRRSTSGQPRSHTSSSHKHTARSPPWLRDAIRLVPPTTTRSRPSRRTKGVPATTSPWRRRPASDLHSSRHPSSMRRHLARPSQPVGRAKRDPRRHRVMLAEAADDVGRRVRVEANLHHQVLFGRGYPKQRRRSANLALNAGGEHLGHHLAKRIEGRLRQLRRKGLDQFRRGPWRAPSASSLSASRLPHHLLRRMPPNLHDDHLLALFRAIVTLKTDDQIQGVTSSSSTARGRVLVLSCVDSTSWSTEL